VPDRAEQIRLTRIATLSDTDGAAMRDLSNAVYPPAETANAPGRTREWASAEWGVLVHGEDGALLSYVGITLRDAELDGRPVRTGGIGGVKTHPAARGRGLAARGIARATEFFHEQRLAFALLVCQPHLLDYYAGLGWCEFTGWLRVRQFGAPEDFTFNRVMTYGVGDVAPRTGTIHLLGPPW
jgi:aminoglycoside 2'-N-acetyltransferase I